MMIMYTHMCSVVAVTLLVLGVCQGHTQETVFSFGVMPQRTATLTAQYWNPILNYISTRSGVCLQLKPNKTASEHATMIKEGVFDFAYSNYHLIPAHDGAGYQIFARPWESAINGDIVVLAGSPIQSLQELAGKAVGFPHPAAFVGYLVTMDKLLHEGIYVTPVFGGNQEGIMGQLRAGSVVAAGVNSQVMRDFAERAHFEYRVLWRSEEHLNIPIAAHPRVPKDKVAAVRKAFLNMAQETQGMQVLVDSAKLLQLDPHGFVAVEDSNYANTRSFFRNALVESE